MGTLPLSLKPSGCVYTALRMGPRGGVREAQLHFAITLPVHAHQRMPVVPSQARSHPQDNGPA